MHTMTRRFFSLTVVLSVGFLLIGCGESSPVGTWTLDKPAMRVAVKASMERRMAANTGQDSQQTLELMRKMLDDMVEQLVDDMSGTLTIREDGTFHVEGSFGAINLVNGTWTRAEDQIAFDADGAQDDVIGTLRGDMIHLTPRSPREGLAADYKVVFQRMP